MDFNPFPPPPISWSDSELESDQEDLQEKPICACGQLLSAGWVCPSCRKTCLGCRRALAPKEECSRCV
ncbi:hypothetical protein BY458DRAFT_465425 [Sporodiniella umbellata]|nr:hypothetical protein BY458DRAFT_465425 [Sporodiniella umbellata]